MKIPTLTIVLAVAALGALFVAVDAGVKSHAVERTQTKTAASVEPAKFATFPIAGADADVNSVNW